MSLLLEICYKTFSINWTILVFFIRTIKPKSERSKLNAEKNWKFTRACVCPYLFYYRMMQAILNAQVNRIKPLWAGFAEAFDVYPKQTQCIYWTHTYSHPVPHAQSRTQLEWLVYLWGTPLLSVHAFCGSLTHVRRPETCKQRAISRERCCVLRPRVWTGTISAERMS